MQALSSRGVNRKWHDAAAASRKANMEVFILEITYIGHSGFLMEWDSCYWLFDYYTGEMPEFKKNKRLYVFVSHNHMDHFNPVIFKLFESHYNITYILSSDVKLKNKAFRESGITEEKKAEIMKKIVFVKPSAKYELHDNEGKQIILQTLKSTDCGVAFLLSYDTKTVYHAGDLNLWLWEGDSKQESNNMIASFRREMEHLKDLEIDYAFVPLDPRQEKYYDQGMEYLLQTARVKYVFPMHFWGKAEIIRQFKQSRTIDPYTNIIDINKEGQRWTL